MVAKNFIVFAVSSLAFFVVGFGLMFGDGTGFMGLSGFVLAGADNSEQPGLDGLKVTAGIRVSPVEETEGLDVGEHGMEAYAGFVKSQDIRAEVI